MYFENELNVRPILNTTPQHFLTSILIFLILFKGIQILRLTFLFVSSCFNESLIYFNVNIEKLVKQIVPGDPET